MQPIAGQHQQPYSQSSTIAPAGAAGGSSILNECRAVSSSVDSIDPKLAQLQSMQDDFLRSGNTTNRDIESFSTEIMATYRELAGKVKRIKSKPAAGERMNKPQVDLLDKKIKTKIADYQKLESAFREKTREQQARQYRIVNPQASEAEVREATYDGGDVQVFQQALLNSNRQGQAQSTLRNVQQRHDAIQQIEKTMLELQQLFQDLDQIVVEQEPMVQNIEQKAEETNQHLVAGNTEVGKAVKSARAARKKKWICLGIVGEFSPSCCFNKIALLTASSRHHHHRNYHRSRLPRRDREIGRQQQQQQQ